VRLVIILSFEASSLLSEGIFVVWHLIVDTYYYIQLCHFLKLFITSVKLVLLMLNLFPNDCECLFQDIWMIENEFYMTNMLLYMSICSHIAICWMKCYKMQIIFQSLPRKMFSSILDDLLALVSRFNYISLSL